MPIVVGIALAVVVDLDSPRLGIITASQRPMLRVRHDIAADVQHR
jgi:hypothetical protein